MTSCLVCPISISHKDFPICRKDIKSAVSIMVDMCSVQRISICDGRIFEVRHARTEVDFCIIVEYNVCLLIINVKPELKLIKDLPPIVLPSSPTIANTFVGCCSLSNPKPRKSKLSFNYFVILKEDTKSPTILHMINNRASFSIFITIFFHPFSQHLFHLCPC